MAGEPRQFGPYRLVRRLGVGGMAETFEAARVGAGGFEQRVCLKRVLPAFSEDEDFVFRFEREAKLAAQLRHTNIVGVIDAGEIDGARYMALELVDGVDLRSLLKSSPGERLSPDTVALIGIDLAYALEHAHGTLVHRDISPSNILLSRSGEAKLADFGIAKAIDNAKVTASRGAKGKIPYMAPEHMRGESVDGRADLFSLGVVMFEAASGVRPFDGAHDVETMQKILEGDRPPLAELAPHVPPPLREVIERLIAVDREARTESAAQLLEELAAVAPKPSVRRELAATVEGHRGGPQARLHVRAREDERDTELTRLPSTMPPAATTSPKRRRARMALIAAGLLVAGVIALQLGGPSRTDPVAGADTDAVAGADTGAGAGAGADTGAGAGADTGAVAGADADADADTGAVAGAGAARVPKGRLRIVVHPWGEVWIDDVPQGRAPVTAHLSKGRHVVHAGYKLKTLKRAVWIRPGTRREIELTLPEE